MKFKLRKKRETAKKDDKPFERIEEKEPEQEQFVGKKSIEIKKEEKPIEEKQENKKENKPKTTPKKKTSSKTSKKKSSTKKTNNTSKNKKTKSNKPKKKTTKKKTTPKKSTIKEKKEEKKEESKLETKQEKTKKMIMIIDDEKDILFSVENVLKSNDYDVISIDNGKDCLETLEKGELPDLIILDIMMPMMSGWEVQRKIESNVEWKQIPIIFLTARTTPTAAEMCKRLGADYVTKPFDVNDLKNRVKKVLKEKGKEKIS